MIQEQVKRINQIVGEMTDTGKPDPQAVAVALESNQRWIEYLDDLELTVTVPKTAVVVKVNGTTIKFNSVEEMAAWITSQ
jgi:hypothetical protein